ncbi:MAG: hypothetical protein UX02_C0002G0332 [Candidatus Moranbacteria bacterium GW2011_GWC1_45_18]|nr:MAG: hypothetical protein UT79_C0001G0129 [Candidatus Moranbacteria bacterium GW2011_GWC2_40_12]KKT33735.1 MAG: hypothetical protein UW19_C0006G0037 [Candidatus Moranbacteria bacterium GW2011_GWF2_44_10]KKT69768.1 MAG: hypothetical protein UW66_C0062G0004 [Candidatus Moranbacteria bacterium GW2011_GWF1_44_4]KKU00089.1 MAG: hypothetical protein UX02_C0002G0332 [Candidatus Moranbacteria bacterium GW2011_GWC1_45_18]OGI22274.1 MAG: hypothetical protein A2194_00365 [Candidatus Moranbacteria bacte
MDLTSLLNNYLILIPLIIWTLVWKGIALWKSARQGEMIWFIALLLLNTLGILEIIYIFIIERKKTVGIQPDAKIEEFTKKRMV